MIRERFRIGFVFKYDFVIRNSYYGCCVFVLRISDIVDKGFYRGVIRMTDLISSVTNAVVLATRLREISKNIENAEFKNLLADLSLELADAKLNIADLVAENAKLKEQVYSLTSVTGELCPKCNNRTFELIATRPHPIFGEVGAKEREYKCSNCDFTECKLIDP